MNDASIVKQFTTHLRQALAQGMQFAAEFGHKQTTSEHILYGLASQKGSISAELLTAVNFPVDLLKQDLIRRHHTPYFNDAKNIPDFDEQAIVLLSKAVRTASAYHHTYIGTEHVLASLVEDADKALRELCQIWQVNMLELQRKLSVVLKSTSKFPDLTQTIRLIPTSEEQREEQPEFPSLSQVAKELTTAEHIATCPPLVGREEEISRLQHILGRRYKNNPLLVGKPGVGKTAVVEGLARAIMSGQAPAFLQGKRIFALELSSMVAGTMYRGDFEQRLRNVIDEIKADPNIIVFIDEVHTLVGAGASGQPLDAANMLKPALARGDIRCIGATTWEEYQKYVATDAALARRFQTVMIDEPSREETRAVLEGVKNTFEEFHRVQIPAETISAALQLSERYLTHTCWPDKAIDLLDESASRLAQESPQPAAEQKKRALKEKISAAQKDIQTALDKDEYGLALKMREDANALQAKLADMNRKKTRRVALKPEHVRETVANRTGIPAQRLHVSAIPTAASLQAALVQTVLGQDEAIQTLTTAIQRGYSPLKEAQKPMGAFLFLGPSGVGKTATAKALAKHVLGDEQNLIRLDMSEYHDHFTLSKLIGAPAGYVGYQQSGTLTNAVRQKPLSVVLFDEVEKAHPDIFNILLQILDEGTLLDGSGQKIDFRHTLIILTSNLGLHELRHRLGFGANASDSSEQRQTVTSSVKAFFKEELLNRLDGIIHFQPLGVEARKAIIKMKIDQLEKKLDEQVSFSASEEALQHLAVDAYQQDQGVRSLERLIKEHIEYPLVELLPKTKQKSTIDIGIKDGRIFLA